MQDYIKLLNTGQALYNGFKFAYVSRFDLATLLAHTQRVACSLMTLCAPGLRALPRG